jgi:hypothetical protein
MEGSGEQGLGGAVAVGGGGLRVGQMVVAMRSRRKPGLVVSVTMPP